MSKERPLKERLILFIGGEKVWAIVRHIIVGILSGFIVDLLGPMFLEKILQIPPDAFTDLIKVSMSVMVGFFASLCSYVWERFREETSHTYLEIKSAVDEFLRLMYHAIPSIKGTGVASSDTDLRNFIHQFKAKDKLLQSFAQVNAVESGRHFDIIEKALSGKGDASYHNQIQIASILCSQGHERLWATSTDPSVVFHRENALYYHALTEAAEHYHNTNRSNPSNAGIPYLCRIFICSKGNLDYSLMLYDMDFLEMYQRHILWAGKRNGEPLKFLITEVSPEKEIELANGRKNDIEDFMVVDNSFVYGRKGEYHKHFTQLRLIRNEAEVKRYAEIFCKLYHKSKNILDILYDKLQSADIGEKEKHRINYLMTLCRYIKNKAENRELYGSRFERNEQQGHPFFNKVCEYIGNNKPGGVIAVDIADKKVSHFYKAWLEQDTYKTFLQAGAMAVKNQRSVFRLFVLNAKPQDASEDGIKGFLKFFLRDGIAIGFISEKNAANVFDKERDRVRFELDFLLTGVPSEFLPGQPFELDNNTEYRFKAKLKESQTLGFELFGDEPFVEEMLDWERNLVDEDGMWRKLESFTRLWNEASADLKSKKIDCKSTTEVESEANRLWEELKKMENT
jgi:hypothetical protein